MVDEFIKCCDAQPLYNLDDFYGTSGPLTHIIYMT